MMSIWFLPEGCRRYGICHSKDFMMHKRRPFSTVIHPSLFRMNACKIFAGDVMEYAFALASRFAQ